MVSVVTTVVTTVMTALVTTLLRPCFIRCHAGCPRSKDFRLLFSDLSRASTYRTLNGGGGHAVAIFHGRHYISYNSSQYAIGRCVVGVFFYGVGWLNGVLFFRGFYQI